MATRSLLCCDAIGAGEAVDAACGCCLRGDGDARRRQRGGDDGQRGDPAQRGAGSPLERSLNRSRAGAGPEHVRNRGAMLGLFAPPRLRVAIGTKDPSNDYTLELLDPSGSVVATGSNGDFPGEHYATELFAPNPEPGAWTMRVVPENVVSGGFEARAKLEGPSDPGAAAGASKGRTCKKHKKRAKRAKHGKQHKPCKKKKKKLAARSAPSGPTQELPNLQVDPPWEVGFRAPLPAIPPGPLHLSSFMTELGIHGTDAELAGLNPDSCSYDETIESSADTHCLRFSTGIPNFGDGPFTIWGNIDPTDPEGDGALTGPLDQRIYKSDGSYTDVQAGSYQFHPIHFHLHVTNLAEFRLFHVIGDQLTPDGSMVEMGQGLKEGFCLVDVKMATFTQFIQGEPNPQGDCLPHPDQG